MRVKPNAVVVPEGLGVGRRRKRAVYVGRMSDEKGVRTIVEAWRGGLAWIPLLMVGSGPLDGELRGLAAGNESVTFTGGLPAAEAYRAIGESELLLLPTECYETFGRTVLEAYALGTPVISTRGTAPGCLVREGETGFLVDRGDVEGLRGAVAGFFDLPDERRRELGVNALRVYEAEFSEAANLAILESIYREAMDEAAARMGRS